jgi:hypothetical protein
MSNLNSPAIKRGPLLASEMHRVTVLPAGLDQQGRYQVRDWPDTVPTQPAECCTELGADPDPYDGTALVRGLMSAIGITALLAGAVLVFA